MSQNYPLSEKDFRTRRLWLRVNFFCSLVFPVCAVIGTLLLNHQGSVWMALLALAVALIVCFFGARVAILHPLLLRLRETRHAPAHLGAFPQSCGECSDNLVSTFREGWHIGEGAWLNLALAGVVFSWTYVLNLRLRKINKLLQVARRVCQPEIHHELTRMKNVLSLEVLDYAYDQLIQKWPQWRRIAAMEYKRKKLTVKE